MSVWYEKFGNIDRRLLYAALIIGVLVPLVRPIGLPLVIDPMVRSAYNVIQALPEGSLVVFACNVNPGTEAENWPSAVAMGGHLIARKSKIIMLTLYADGWMYADRFIREVATPLGYKYGEDIVLLEFKAGVQNILAAFAKDPVGAFSKDYKGAALSSLPIMQNLKTIKDIKLYYDIVQLESGKGAVAMIEPAGVPVIAAATAVFAPELSPYMASGQLKGMVVGLAGSAAYESLVKKPGRATAGMDAQSIGHLLIAVCVILGNIAHAASRRSGKGGA
jgi:hypothetical protein